MNHFRVGQKISALLLFLVFSCKSRSYNDESKSKGFFDFSNADKSFDSQVVRKRKCNAEFLAKHSLLTFKTPTMFFHWTNDEQALTEPFKYMSAIVSNSNKLNSELNRNVVPADVDSAVRVEGAAGAGLYIAPNPFVSYSYGAILIAFRVNIATQFPEVKGRQVSDKRRGSVETQMANCPGVIYPFGVRNIGNPSSDKDGKAIVLWDLDSIDPKSVVVIGPKSKISPNYGPYFEELFQNREGLNAMFSNAGDTLSENYRKLVKIREYWNAQPSLYNWE